MIDNSDIANRHMLPSAGMSDPGNVQSLSVRIIADDPWAASVPGQLFISCLINLLSRQAKIVSWVEVVAKNTPLLVPLPDGVKEGVFPACLQDLAAWAVKNSDLVSTQPTDKQADITLLIGSPRSAAISPKGITLSALGDGWTAWIGEPSRAPQVQPSQSYNPLGPFLAAALASGEIFKRSRGILRGCYFSANGYSLWNGVSNANWDKLDNGPELAGRTLPPVHVVGVGAVGNGLAYVIGNAKFNDPYLVLVDDDFYDGTNLNRCVLAGWEDIEQSKVKAVGRFLDLTQVGYFPFRKVINDYLLDLKSGLRADIAADVNALKFDLVVSCVDKGKPRQDIQGLWPRRLFGGSTLNLIARSDIYGQHADTPCLGCWNPSEKEGDKLRALESKLRNMEPEDRRRFLISEVLAADAIEQYLATAQCGSIGEAALRDFATRPNADFSVGFVSLGAVLLLSSALFRRVIFSEISPNRYETTYLNFLNGGFSDNRVSVDEHCELDCRGKRRA